MSKEISLPFRLAPNGTIAVDTDPNDQIKNHIYSLVLTEPGERVMIPQYGIPLTSLVLELDDALIQAHMLNLVQQAMAKWEPGVIIRAIEPVGSVHGDGISTIKVDYQRRESGLNPGIPGRKVNTAYVGINGEVTEVIRG